MKTLKDLPSPAEHWLKGSLGRFDPEQLHHYFYQHAQQLGPIYKIHLLKKPAVVIADPEAIQTILKQRPDTYRRVSRMESVFKEMGIHGVFSAEGDEWSRYRKLLNPAFRTSQIKAFYDSLYAITERLCRAVARDAECFDFQQMIQRYTVDITSLLSFGYDINTLEKPDNELQQHLCKIFPMVAERNKAPLTYWRLFKLKKDRQLDQSLQFVRNQVAVFIDAAREKLAARESQGAGEEILADNMLESMLLARDESGQGFSDDEIFGNVITLLLAGEDTTANTLAWAIDYLADDGDLQDRLFMEIEQNLPRGNSAPLQLSWSQLDACPLVIGVIQEALRLKAAAQFLFLEGRVDSEILGYQIPRGVMLFALLSASSFDTRLFDNPQEFRPERWQRMSADKLKRVNRELMPFGGGPRLCPGRLLSLVEMKMALIELLRRFKFERAQGCGSATERLRFTLIPDGLMVCARAR